MLFSLFRNNREKSTVYLLHKDLTAKSVEELRLFLERCGDVSLVEKRMDSRLFADAPRMKWWSEEMYYRLLAFALIPEERALWLDADIIVNGDIREFYYQELKGYYCSACAGSDQSWAQLIGLEAGRLYFNSGVILYNLDEIRKNHTIEDVLRCLNEHSDNLKAPDQDILNLLYQGKVVYSDPAMFNHEVFGDFIYSKNERSFIMHQAKIIHFNGPVKPWDPKGANSAGELWWKYELLQGNKLEYYKYKIFHFPTKCRYGLREIYFIILAQLKKLHKR